MITFILFYNIFIGVYASLCTMYSSEIAPLKLRGALGSLNQTANNIGTIISQSLGLSQILGTDKYWPLLLSKYLLMFVTGYSAMRL